ncbi:hypothetical protein SHKM778_56420 [Streptomyces sp. KM77-8]|uniref:Inositol 2-dehydrogenase n=1 Tax=Streptomyces haneummycinicus TaxID=3074435 RepID=A0AAT9HPL4_9ACTN
MSRREPLGVAVIGTGRMGADHVRRIDRVVSGARVTAVVDLDAERAGAAAVGVDGCTVYTDPAAAMAAADVDAVLIASSGPAHEAALLTAFERDLPVLCEKPLTPDAASALRVMEAEAALGHRRVQVGFMRRYDAEYARLKSLLESGELGRPLMLHNRHRNVASAPFFSSGMLITDSVAHEVDATRWLLGHEIAAVTVLRPTPSSGAPEGLLDPQFVVLETDGVRCPTSRSSSTAGSGTRCRRRWSASGGRRGSVTGMRWSPTRAAGGAARSPRTGRNASPRRTTRRSRRGSTRRGAVRWWGRARGTAMPRRRCARRGTVAGRRRPGGGRPGRAAGAVPVTSAV